MYAFAYAPPTLGGARTRTLLAAGAGALVGFLAPKIMGSLTGKGVPADQAADITRRVIEGAMPPPKNALSPEELARLQQLQRESGSSRLPAGWTAMAFPMLAGGVVIYALTKAFSKR